MGSYRPSDKQPVLPATASEKTTIPFSANSASETDLLTGREADALICKDHIG
jgi:hypothetical protein